MGEEGGRVLLQLEGVRQGRQVLHQMGVATSPQAVSIENIGRLLNELALED